MRPFGALVHFFQTGERRRREYRFRRDRSVGSRGRVWKGRSAKGHGAGSHGKTLAELESSCSGGKMLKGRMTLQTTLIRLPGKSGKGGRIRSLGSIRKAWSTTPQVEKEPKSESPPAFGNPLISQTTKSRKGGRGWVKDKAGDRRGVNPFGSYRYPTP